MNIRLIALIEMESFLRSRYVFSLQIRATLEAPNLFRKK